MKFLECLPFVRFAYKICFKSNTPAVAKDCRLFYVTDGEGTIIIDKKEYFFSPGTVILWQSGSEYYITMPKETTLVSINFDYTANNSHIITPHSLLKPEDKEAEEIKKQQIFFDDCSALNHPIVCTGNSQIHSLIEKILFESTSCQPYYRERISALFKECLVLIVREVSIPADTRSDGALEKVMEYIHKNYNKDIDNTTLARLVGYHPYYLNKLFLSANGVTLHKYVINYRIAMSEQLLLASNASIEDIALRVGFSGSSSFSSSFKKKNGITPTKFRKKFGATL